MAVAPEPLAEDVELARPVPPRSWRERLEQVADATGSTPSRLLVGTVLAVVAVAGGLWLTRPPADPVETTLPFASTTTGLAAASSSTSEPTVVVVHVAGAVARPGVYELALGARWVDAVTAAGGLTAQADHAQLNLAALLADGERVYVAAVGEVPPPDPAGASGGPAGSGPGARPDGKLDLNSADEAALDALPGVGPATATAIVEHRARIGRFSSVEQLLDVRGIGEAKLEALRDLVAV